MVSLVITDTTGVYWATSAGEVTRSSFDGTKKAMLGTSGAGPTAIAVDSTYVYVAAGNALYRVKKGPDS
jgi:hypothetical protein